MRWTLGALFGLAFLLPVHEARAQCIGFPVQTNQTCTNSGALTDTSTISGHNVGLQDLGTLTVTNTGTITGTGPFDFGFGIEAPAVNVINFGTISGVGNSGIYTGPANVTNYGTISGGERGIFAGPANITNFGIISGGIHGLWLYGSTDNVTNSGTITGIIGIRVDGVGNVTNSGTVIGTGGIAIQFAGNADTLTLLPGSRIIGAINLGGGGDTVNFRGGNHNLTFATLAGVIVTGTTPFVVVGNRAVAIDPTGFAMADRALMDFTRGISSIIDSRLGQMPVGGSSLPSTFAPESNVMAQVNEAFANMPLLNAYAGEAIMFKNPTAVSADGTAVWARGFLGQQVQHADGPTLRAINNYFGGAIGVDRLVSPDLRLGAFIGGGDTRMNIDLNSGSADSNMVFGGVYGRYEWAASFLDFALYGGGSQNKTTRNINNNLVPGGIETATASYDGWFISPELAYGVRYALAGNYTLTPTARVRYVAGFYDGYTETGSTANLTVKGRTIQDLEERFDLTLTHSFVRSTMLLTSVHAGVLGLQRLGDTSVNTVLLGANLPFVTPGKTSLAGLYAGADFEWRTTERFSFFGGAEYIAMSDSSSIISGKGGVRVTF